MQQSQMKNEIMFRLSFQPSLLFYSKWGKLCAKRQTLHKIASLSGKTKWIRKLFDQCVEKKNWALSLLCTINITHEKFRGGGEYLNMEWKIKSSQFVDYFEYQETCRALTRKAMTSVNVVTDTATPRLDLPQKAFSQSFYPQLLGIRY